MQRLLALLLLVIATPVFAKDAAQLRVYFVDVEGGQATLFVTPKGESLLVDTGWPGHEGRDAKRIAKAAKSAGLSRIDYVLITHYHDDHVGGVPNLVAAIPVGTFVDHGPNREPKDAVTEDRYEAYQKVLASGKYKHLTVKPGDRLPLEGLDVQVVTADGATITEPLQGAGEANPYCAASEKRAADQTENARSLGVMIRFGEARVLDLGDLTWDKEMELMCPANRIGKVDVLVVSHHGFEQSNSPALVDAVQPRVAVMDNGARKGGSKATFETIAKIPGGTALWQLHYSEEAGSANAPEKFLANLKGPDGGHGLVLTVSRQGELAVTNVRTGETVKYVQH